MSETEFSSAASTSMGSSGTSPNGEEWLVDHLRHQPSPKRKPGMPPIIDLVMEDFRRRDEFGRRKYGGPLVGNDGRDTLADALQEAMDLVMYLRKLIWEREGR